MPTQTHTHTQKIHEFIYCTILHACMFPQRPGSRDEAPTGNVRSVETSPDEGNRQETQEVRLDYLTFICYIIYEWLLLCTRMPIILKYRIHCDELTLSSIISDLCSVDQPHQLFTGIMLDSLVTSDCMVNLGYCTYAPIVVYKKLTNRANLA